MWIWHKLELFTRFHQLDMSSWLTWLKWPLTLTKSTHIKTVTVVAQYFDIDMYGYMSKEIFVNNIMYWSWSCICILYYLLIFLLFLFIYSSLLSCPWPQQNLGPDVCPTVSPETNATLSRLQSEPCRLKWPQEGEAWQCSWQSAGLLLWTSLILIRLRVGTMLCLKQSAKNRYFFVITLCTCSISCSRSRSRSSRIIHLKLT